MREKAIGKGFMVQHHCSNLQGGVRIPSAPRPPTKIANEEVGSSAPMPAYASVARRASSERQLLNCVFLWQDELVVFGLLCFARFHAEFPREVRREPCEILP